MKVKEAINTCLRDRKMSKSALAKKLGYGMPSYIINKVGRGQAMTTANLMEILDGLGYDLVIKDRISGSELVLEREVEE